MKKRWVLGLVFMLLAAPAWATLINPIGGGNGSELSVQQIMNNFTAGGTSTASQIADQDAIWQITGNGTSAATLIIELAGNANINEFGIYQFNGSTPNLIQLFAGPQSGGSKTAVTILNNGDVYTGLNAISLVTPQGHFSQGTSFGYYLQTDFTQRPVLTWYSEMVRNSDGMDHMVTFQGIGDTITLPAGSGTTTGQWAPGEYLLAFEDMPINYSVVNQNGYGDWDFNDMLVMVESVKPVPEPGTMMLLGSGLVGLAGWGRKKFRK